MNRFTAWLSVPLILAAAVDVPASEPAGHCIQGRVVDSAGSGIEGVMVSAIDDGHRKWVSVFSQQDGSLLDQTSVLLGSNLGNANAHDPSNLPIIVAGGGYAHGRYVACDESNNTPLCNLFVSLLNHLGVETESFGSSTGSLKI